MPGTPVSVSTKYEPSSRPTIENAIIEENGGPHEFSQIGYGNYNMATGAIFSLDDIFIKGGKYILDSMGDICFRKQYNLGPDADFKAPYALDAGLSREDF